MKVGLALSGGGMRSVVHLGMMQVLEEEGVAFDVISGASAGAVVGALRCSGYKPLEILEIIDSINFLKVIKPAFNWRGLLKIESAARTLKKYIKEDNFKNLKKPLIVSATDLSKGQIKYFKKGQLIKPVLASCSLPVIFDPVVINGVSYIDGGVLDNLPVLPLRKKCDFIIGMHSNPIGKNHRANNWKELMERSLLLSISGATYQKKKKCDVFWEPLDVAKYNVFDFRKAREIYQVGYDYARSQLASFPFEKLMSAA